VWETCLFLEHVSEGEPGERLHFTLHTSVRFPEQRSAQEGNSLSAQGGSQPQEKRSRSVTTQHDPRIRDFPSHGTKRISITQPSNSRSTSRTTGNIRFLPSGTWECIPECMPENIPRNNFRNVLGIFFI